MSTVENVGLAAFVVAVFMGMLSLPSVFSPDELLQSRACAVSVHAGCDDADLAGAPRDAQAAVEAPPAATPELRPTAAALSLPGSVLPMSAVPSSPSIGGGCGPGSGVCVAAESLLASTTPTMYLDPTLPDDIRAAMRRSAGQIGASTSLTFTETDDAGSADVVVRGAPAVFTGSGADRQPVYGKTACVGAVVGAACSQKQITLATGTDPTLLNALALHELGHAVGLSHSDDHSSPLSVSGWNTGLLPGELASIDRAYAQRSATGSARLVASASRPLSAFVLADAARPFGTAGLPDLSAPDLQFSVSPNPLGGSSPSGDSPGRIFDVPDVPAYTATNQFSVSDDFELADMIDLTTLVPQPDVRLDQPVVPIPDPIADPVAPAADPAATPVLDTPADPTALLDTDAGDFAFADPGQINGAPITPMPPIDAPTTTLAPQPDVRLDQPVVPMCALQSYPVAPAADPAATPVLDTPADPTALLDTDAGDFAFADPGQINGAPITPMPPINTPTTAIDPPGARSVGSSAVRGIADAFRFDVADGSFLQPEALTTAPTASVDPPTLPLPPVMLGKPLYASVFFPNSQQPDVPLDVGQTGDYTVDGARWRVTSLEESRLEDGSLEYAVIRYTALDADGQAEPYEPVLAASRFETQQGRNYRVTDQILESGDDGATHIIRRQYEPIDGPLFDRGAGGEPETGGNTFFGVAGPVSRYARFGLGTLSDPSTGKAALVIKLGASNIPANFAFINYIPVLDTNVDQRVKWRFGLEGGARFSDGQGSMGTYKTTWDTERGLRLHNLEYEDRLQSIRDAVNRGAGPVEVAHRIREYIGVMQPMGESFAEAEVTIPLPGELSRPVTQWANTRIRELRQLSVEQTLRQLARRSRNVPNAVALSRLLRGDGTLDTGLIDRYAAPPQTPQQIFEAVPEPASLPTLDRSTLPTDRTGSVLLPELPRVDRSVFDVITPHLPDNLPRPVVDANGNAVVIDLPGPDSGVLAYDEQGRPILIELSDEEAGRPAYDEQGRPIIINLPMPEPLPIDDDPPAP